MMVNMSNWNDVHRQTKNAETRLSSKLQNFTKAVSEAKRAGRRKNKKELERANSLNAEVERLLRVFANKVEDLEQAIDNSRNPKWYIITGLRQDLELIQKEFWKSRETLSKLNDTSQLFSSSRRKGENGNLEEMEYLFKEQDAASNARKIGDTIL